MNFRPELAQAILDGKKTVTRRLPSDNPRSPWWREGCSLRVNRLYAVCPGRGKNAVGRVVVTDVRMEPLHGVMAEGEPEKEGFASYEDFRTAWCEINGAIYLGEYVWRVEFVLIQPGDYKLWEGGR